ncbi:MAG: YjfB family protein [Rhodocyclales bacterium]|nr:YjfB family protein [Rhodocyclales bacterium]
MDTAAIASLATDMSQARTAEAVQITVLRKALDVQAQGALQLLEAVQLPANNPPHLGNSVDTFA